MFNRADRDALAALSKKIDAFKATSPHAPPRAHVLNDAASRCEPVVFLRGNPNNRGPQVPRQAPAVVAAEPQAVHRRQRPAGTGAGDRQPGQPADRARDGQPRLARPLRPRARPHARATSASRCDPPTHPELLDWLATQFVKDGWCVKKLHKLIMLSATYQQSSRGLGGAVQARSRRTGCSSHQNRRRLDFEALRDALLVGRRPARPDGGRQAGRSVQGTVHARGAASTASSTARTCPARSARSTSPARTRTARSGSRRPCRSRRCS